LRVETPDASPVVADEELLLEYRGGLFLTNRRIYLNTKNVGGRHLVSIMLEELCSSEVHHVSQPLLLVLAAIALIVGSLWAVAAAAAWPLIAGGVAAVVLAVLYGATQRQMLTFASGGSRINVASSQRIELAIDFIDAVEEAKNKRHMLRPDLGSSGVRP
jgi:hypothetical protein